VLRRSFVVVVLVVLASACGGKEAASVGTSTPQAALLVTQDCGRKVLVDLAQVAAQQTAMRALDRVADIETDSGGKFVTAVNGVEQDTGKKLAWLYYVNGKAAQKGATEVKLAPGDVEWWDLHNYERECASVPAEAR
jgi:Domain of unknown function (DUF4430)